MNEWPGEFLLVNPAELVVDHVYQRGEKQNLIDHIAREPNWEAFGVVTCRRREKSGVLYVVDGQQRLEGVKRSQNPPKKVPVVVLPSEGREAEAGSFVKINLDRKPVDTFDKFRALLVAKDPAALAIDEAVRKAEYAIGAGGGGNKSTRQITAISTLFVIYERLGPDGLTQVLVQCRDAWPDDGAALQVNILRVVMRVIEEQGEKYQRAKLTAALSLSSPALIMRKSEELRFRHGSSRQDAVRDAVQVLCKV